MESLSQAAQAEGGMSLESYFQQLRQLIQRQKGLNEETRRLDMQDSSRPSFQEELERIAREQEAVRQELQKLAEQQKKAKELMGDMDGIGDDMGKIEKMLQEKITDERVQEKQEQVYTRLLDAERSQRQEDSDKERESTPATGELAAQDAPPLTEDEILQRLDQPEDRLIGDLVLPRYRTRVRSYYRRLSEQVFSNP
jgi:seryl-tRNA synthetase